jgi:hypothetical protein
VGEWTLEFGAASNRGPASHSRALSTPYEIELSPGEIVHSAVGDEPRFAYRVLPSICYGGAGSPTEIRMPVTARLSRKFYDTFGDEIANELA